MKGERSNSLGCCKINSSDISVSESSKYDGQSNNNTIFHTNHYGECDSTFPKRESVDIEFQDMKYTVRKLSFEQRTIVSKEILHGISGAFRSGELSAIMGPSGAGKSSLLNIMTGYIATGVTGNVQVNGKPVSIKSAQFRSVSRYIHQQNLLRSALTVCETMTVAAHLKLGFKVSREYKMNIIKRILDLLGLANVYNSYTGTLSGGQQKRLAIALELISNPPVLFLDEPTTGLDSSSSNQCISLLKRLAQEGHTVVCTIHQPSALLFEMFDKLYTLVDGNCIYQGTIKELVPFLSGLGFNCPSYHNPADYLLEIATGEHDADIEKIAHYANKKYYADNEAYQIKQHNKEFQDSDGLTPIELDESLGCAPTSDLYHLENTKNISDRYINSKSMKKKATDVTNIISPASVWMQFFLLLRRNFICSTRNYFLIGARILSHIVIAGVFGYLYLNVGSTATTVLANYVYFYGTILLIVYTGKMAVVMSFPIEMEILSREHFNRWYRLGPYFMSILAFEIPFQILCVFLYMVISFWLTGNFSEDFRFYYFILMGLMATLSAQAWGFFVGATFSVQIAVFIGPVLAVIFSIFGFCTRFIDITPYLSWMWHISYFRAAFHGVLNAVYGMNRPFLDCPDTEMYCHFRSGKVFLNYMMITDVSMNDSVCLMSSVIVIMHVLTILTLWYKLTKR